MNAISRRNMLKQLALGGLLLMLPAALVAGPATEVFRPLASRLKGIFRHAHSARVVGHRYLALMPAEADAALLAARIAGTRQFYLRLAGADDAALHALIAARQQNDFIEGRTVSIDGWVLSRTEARLCALAALDVRPRAGSRSSIKVPRPGT